MRPLRAAAILLFLLAFLAAAAGMETTVMPETTSPDNRQARLRALHAKGPDYRARTRHLNPDGSPKYINRLIFESSPYLLQHAHNPVDWHAWSPQAFALAKAQNKPIFLSIGYATCHWCHVMEEESFEDPEVAAYLNKHFVPVKVDREERPAVDEYYMMAVQMLTGHGGWPMSTFLTPEGQPFFGGTYYPKPAFLQLLQRVAEVWQQQPAALQKQAAELDGAIRRYLAARSSNQAITAEASHAAVDQMLKMHDEMQGGFGTAPKFPQETWLLFLQDMALRSGDSSIQQALANTLAAMQQGGINDQVGGGFHRYATDPAWLVPHFEKMLYDQAQLAEVYTRAWLQHGRLEDRRSARRILHFLLRDMRSAEGVFYSASDADSRNQKGEMEEGAYFTWSLPEFRQALAALPQSEQKMAEDVYGVTASGNFEGRNILHRRQSIEQLADKYRLDSDALLQTLDRINARLLAARNRRPRPLIDKKIITAWNAHAIRSLALAGDALAEPALTRAATKAAQYLWQHHRWPDKKTPLIRSSLAGKPSALAAQLEDYAQFLLALLELYDRTGEADWLHKAEQLYSEMPDDLNAANGGFYDNSVEAGIPWQQRLQKSADGATASGQALMLQALARLWHRTGNAAYQQRFQQAAGAIAGSVQQSPLSHASVLLAHHLMSEGEMENVTWAGGGRIRLQARRTGADRFSLQVDIAPGWHLTAHDAGSQQAFRLTTPAHSGLVLNGIEWPPSASQSLSFQDEPLKTWDKSLRIEGKLSPATPAIARQHAIDPSLPKAGEKPEARPNQGLPLLVSLQACNDTICLPPEKVAVLLPAAGE